MATKVSKGELTRQKILKASLKLFAQNGYFETSFQDIANQLELTQSAVMNHFKNKYKLLEEVRSVASKSNHDWVDSHITIEMNGLDSLIEHCYQNLFWCFKHKPECQLILLCYYYASVDKKFFKLHKMVEERAAERILKYIKAARREDLVHSSVKDDLLAESIQHYLRGLCLRDFSLYKKSEVNFDQYRKEINRNVKAILS